MPHLYLETFSAANPATSCQSVTTFADHMDGKLQEGDLQEGYKKVIYKKVA